MSRLPTLLVKGSLRLPEGINYDTDSTPIEYIISWLRKRMPEFGGLSADINNRVLVIRAETGSGKSTVLPVSVFRLLRSKQTFEKMLSANTMAIITVFIKNFNFST